MRDDVLRSLLSLIYSLKLEEKVLNSLLKKLSK